MLKKLVKYGNSNAIILDKAILELLEIEEGSVIKIKTDGKSIIITPQAKVASTMVHETFTNEEAMTEAVVKESIKQYKNIDKDEQTRLEKKLLALHKKFRALSARYPETQEFRDEVKELAQKMDISSIEYIQAFKALRNKISPELAAVEEEITNFAANNKLSTQENGAIQNLSQEQRQAMSQEYLELFRKRKIADKQLIEYLDNPEYQHEAQLIAEKFNFDKNSTDYLQALQELMQKYNPRMKEIQDEAKAIAEKYSKIDQK